jgi:hypothetical protein
MALMRTLLICHHDAPLHSEGVAGWLASWSELTGILVIREPVRVLRRRLVREWRRVGAVRLLDVLAFRAYYRLVHARSDASWLEAWRLELVSRYPVPGAVPQLETATPNSAAAEAFIREAQPTLVIALCKSILAPRIFSIPDHGTWVCHPGICPEYRNAHGCFWALASDDIEHVGLSLLRIDRGVDTGPIFGHFPVTYDEVNESHVRIQHRALLDNLDAIRERLLDVVAGHREPVDVRGRSSREWGQPWLTAWARWKRHARGRADARHRA